MNSLYDFVVNGKIGQVYLGISKTETLDLLREPKDWLGKKTIIGKTHEFYHESDLWFYYAGSVGVRFGTKETAEEIIIYPEHSEKCSELFKDWPIVKTLKMGGWRDALKKNYIPFRESSSESLNYWIVAGQTCVTCCFPFANGKTLSADERIVEMLQKYSDAEVMQRECGFLNLP